MSYLSWSMGCLRGSDVLPIMVHGVLPIMVHGVSEEYRCPYHGVSEGYRCLTYHGPWGV